jgi:hypothetical protein
MSTPPARAPVRRIVLDIDQGSDPISGELDDGRGARRFSGWLELAGALQVVIGLAPDEEAGLSADGQPSAADRESPGQGG